MENTRHNIWKDGEYTYRAAYGFTPNIRAYLHKDNKKRDAFLVVPGGGYCMCAPSESEHIAKEFYFRGYNAFVLTYTTDITMSIPLRTQPLMDISRAVRYLRSRGDDFCINDTVVICGFSAGAHLCSMLAVHFDDIEDPDEELNKISARPSAAILCYPVITAGEYTHKYSIQALLGTEQSQEDIDFFSAEKNVTSDTPPCFIWQTQEDAAVPVENSYLMAQALQKAGVKFEHLVFPFGFHGLSLPNVDFFAGNFEGKYTLEQVENAIDHVRAGTCIDVTEERRQELIEQFANEEDLSVPEDEARKIAATYKDIQMWPEMASIFLDKVLK